MCVFLRAKALKTENVNFFLCVKFALRVISFHTITGCMLSSTNCMCNIDSCRQIFICTVECVVRATLTAIHIVVFVIACVEFLKKRGKKPCACNTTEV